MTWMRVISADVPLAPLVADGAAATGLRVVRGSKVATGLVLPAAGGTIAGEVIGVTAGGGGTAMAGLIPPGGAGMTGAVPAAAGATGPAGAALPPAGPKSGGGMTPPGSAAVPGAAKAGGTPALPG